MFAAYPSPRPGPDRRLRPVELGPLSGNMRVIASGLQKEDMVIVNGLLRAQPGNVVDPVNVMVSYKMASNEAENVQSRPAMVALPVN